MYKCVCAVSYTHLDVYKRQMQKEQTKSVANPNNIREENYSKKTSKAVSYTHLDVYKRQFGTNIIQSTRLLCQHWKPS